MYVWQLEIVFLGGHVLKIMVRLWSSAESLGLWCWFGMVLLGQFCYHGLVDTVLMQKSADLHCSNYHSEFILDTGFHLLNLLIVYWRMGVYV